jgi:hypothetical protein
MLTPDLSGAQQYEMGEPRRAGGGRAVLRRLLWLHNAKSGDDAAYIARTIAGDVRSSVPVPSRRGAAGRAANASIS